MHIDMETRRKTDREIENVWSKEQIREKTLKRQRSLEQSS